MRGGEAAEVGVRSRGEGAAKAAEVGAVGARSGRRERASLGLRLRLRTGPAAVGSELPEPVDHLPEPSAGKGDDRKPWKGNVGRV